MAFVDQDSFFFNFVKSNGLDNQYVRVFNNITPTTKNMNCDIEKYLVPNNISRIHSLRKKYIRENDPNVSYHIEFDYDKQYAEILMNTNYKQYNLCNLDTMRSLKGTKDFEWLNDIILNSYIQTFISPRDHSNFLLGLTNIKYLKDRHDIRRKSNSSLIGESGTVSCKGKDYKDSFFIPDAILNYVLFDIDHLQEYYSRGIEPFLFDDFGGVTFNENTNKIIVKEEDNDVYSLLKGKPDYVKPYAELFYRSGYRGDNYKLYSLDPYDFVHILLSNNWYEVCKDHFDEEKLSHLDQSSEELYPDFLRLVKSKTIKFLDENEIDIGNDARNILENYDTDQSDKSLSDLIDNSIFRQLPINQRYRSDNLIKNDSASNYKYMSLSNIKSNNILESNSFHKINNKKYTDFSFSKNSKESEYYNELMGYINDKINTVQNPSLKVQTRRFFNRCFGLVEGDKVDKAKLRENNIKKIFSICFTNRKYLLKYGFSKSISESVNAISSETADWRIYNEQDKDILFVLSTFLTSDYKKYIDFIFENIFKYDYKQVEDVVNCIINYAITIKSLIGEKEVIFPSFEDMYVWLHYDSENSYILNQSYLLKRNIKKILNVENKLYLQVSGPFFYSMMTSGMLAGVVTNIITKNKEFNDFIFNDRFIIPIINNDDNLDINYINKTIDSNSIDITRSSFYLYNDDEDNNLEKIHENLTTLAKNIEGIGIFNRKGKLLEFYPNIYSDYTVKDLNPYLKYIKKTLSDFLKSFD